jgi:hypothetical protein
MLMGLLALCVSAQQPPGKEAAQERLLQQRRDEVRKLEDQVAGLRKDLKRDLGSLEGLGAIEVERAKADWEIARKTREVAEINLEEYERGTLPQERETIEGEISLRKAEVDRWGQELAKLQGRLPVASPRPPEQLAAEFSLKSAEYSLLEAEQRLTQLNKYTSEMKRLILKGDIEKRRSEELIMQQKYLLSEERLLASRRENARFALLAPQALLQTNLMEAARLQAGVSQTLRPLVEMTPPEEAAKPAGGKQIGEGIAKAEDLQTQIVDRLERALELSQFLSTRWEELMEAEEDLALARERLAVAMGLFGEPGDRTGGEPGKAP